MTVHFTSVEKFVPSTDDRIPPFGVIVRGREVVLVFDEDTPQGCQKDVLSVTREYFIHEGVVLEHEVSAFVSERLFGLVSSQQMRRNKFTRKWVWLGDG
jgi:hypothetical protein